MSKTKPILMFLKQINKLTLIINQQMRYIKLHIKILKIAPTYFDPKIILRELSCSLLKSFKNIHKIIPLINLLAPELFFLILAHPVYKM